MSIGGGDVPAAGENAGDKSLERREPTVIEPGRRSRRHPGARLDVGLRQSTYTSPLPSPDDLDRYVAQVPDAAERLMAAGEREQAHRHQIERRLVEIDADVMPRYFAGQRRAHFLGLVLGIAYLGAMVFAMWQGYPLAGVGGATFGIAAVIWAIRREPSASELDA
ncbi:MAG: DUF2335 domain-containing protein [Actinobacteria bacterium]|nr:DUF2335 domain-containing protein [Actinomycetota bacterium]